MSASFLELKVPVLLIIVENKNPLRLNIVGSILKVLSEYCNPTINSYYLHREFFQDLNTTLLISLLKETSF